MTSPPRELAILNNMKTIILAATLFLACASIPAIADGPIEKKLQQALFAEEGTRDLKKAIEAYNAVIADYDQQRKFAATALFRLAECHRKLDEREAAVAAYQRLLKEFPEEQTLSRLASENLRSLGAGAGSGKAGAAPILATDAAEIARIENLVALSPDLINDPETGLLHKAAAKSQLRVAEFLLESGADINLRSRDKLPAPSGFRTLRPTPVSVAAAGGHLAMVKFLLEGGAEVDDHTIIMAGTRKRTAVLDVLIDHLPTDPEMQFHSLRAACFVGRPDIVAALVEAGAPFTIEANYSSPLMLAVEKSDLESIKILLQAGAEPDGDTLLLAVDSGTPTFRAIWNSGVRSPDALSRAIDNPEIAMTIIEGIGDIDQADRNGATALGLACNHLKPDYVRAILARGAEPDKLCSLRLNNNNLTNITPLIGALNSHAHTDSKEEYEEDLNSVISQLFEAGADINARDLNGYNALVYTYSPNAAGRRTPVSVVRQLLAQEPQDSGIDAGPDQLLASPYAKDPGQRLIGYYTASKLPQRAEHIWITNGRSYYKFPPHAGKLSVMVLENPHLFDIGAIQIIRAGEMEPFTIDYAELMASADPAQDPALSAGDILLGRDLSKTNQVALTPEQIAFLTKAGSKQITVSRGEYQWQGTVRPGTRPEFTYDPSSPIVYARTVKTLLDSIQAPTATSELSRIEVRHSDGEISTFNYLIASSTRQGDLELREGDHIVLHPVTSDIPRNAIFLSRETALFLRPFKVGESSNGIDLAEFIAGVYSDRSSVLPSPDFSNITITREGETMEVDAHELSAETPFLLEMGDIVNIPSDGTPTQDWQQLDAAFIEHLQQILPRSAKFQVNSESSRELRVGPGFHQFPITDGMRQFNPLATQGDSGFDVLGLSTKSAIRSLGYLPGNQIRIDFQQSVGSSYTSSQRVSGDFPFPIVEPGDYVLISIGQPTPRVPTRSGARTVPIPRNAPTARQAPPVPTKKPTQRRVVLPPPPKK